MRAVWVLRIGLTSSLAAAEPVGGVSGFSWNCRKAPRVTTSDAAEITEKYCSRPSALPAIAPPTRKAVAIPTWLKLMAMAVQLVVAMVKAVVEKM